MNARILSGTASALLLATASVAAPPPDDACTSAFRASIQPILNTNCVACHQDAAKAGELSLQRTSAPASLVQALSSESKLMRVAPGEPEKSYLYRKLAGTHEAVGGGVRMPLGGKLADADIAAVSNWIKGCKRK